MNPIFCHPVRQWKFNRSMGKELANLRGSYNPGVGRRHPDDGQDRGIGPLLHAKLTRLDAYQF